MKKYVGQRKIAGLFVTNVLNRNLCSLNIFFKKLDEKRCFFHILIHVLWIQTRDAYNVILVSFKMDFSIALPIENFRRAHTPQTRNEAVPNKAWSTKVGLN